MIIYWLNTLKKYLKRKKTKVYLKILALWILIIRDVETLFFAGACGRLDASTPALSSASCGSSGRRARSSPTARLGGPCLPRATWSRRRRRRPGARRAGQRCRRGATWARSAPPPGACAAWTGGGQPRCVMQLLGDLRTSAITPAQNLSKMKLPEHVASEERVCVCVHAHASARTHKHVQTHTLRARARARARRCRVAGGRAGHLSQRVCPARMVPRAGSCFWQAARQLAGGAEQSARRPGRVCALCLRVLSRVGVCPPGARRQQTALALPACVLRGAPRRSSAGGPGASLA